MTLYAQWTLSSAETAFTDVTISDITSISAEAAAEYQNNMCSHGGYYMEAAEIAWRLQRSKTLGTYKYFLAQNGKIGVLVYSG